MDPIQIIIQPSAIVQRAQVDSHIDLEVDLLVTQGEIRGPFVYINPSENHIDTQVYSWFAVPYRWILFKL